MPGDVFLCWSQKEKRYHHAGIVVSVDGRYPTATSGSTVDDCLYVCRTVEGNTNEDGSANGNATLGKVRRFNTFVGDRFIRWVDVNVQSRAA